MVYKKNYRKGKVYTKPKNKKSMLSSKQIANIAKRAVLSTAETKMLPRENETDMGPDDRCTVYSNLSLLSTQGVDNEQRIGDSVQSTGIQVVYSLGSMTSARDYFVRVVLIKANSGEFTNTTDGLLLDTANDPLAPTANDERDIIRSLNRKAFKVMYDKTHSVVKDNGGNGISMIYRKLFFKLRDKRYFSSDTLGDSRDLDNIRMYVIVRDSQGATVAAGNDIHFTCFTRYYYKDI